MSIRSIGLSKVLNLIYADVRQQTSMLRDNIRTSIAKETATVKKTGGDFYIPFWADAKTHVSGRVELRESTKDRISSNYRRARLYPLLTDGFLLWWEQKRRLRNEPFTVVPGNIKGRYAAGSLGMIKVENNLCFTIGEEGHRVVYPYPFEEPALSEEAGRVGLWVMSQAIRDYSLEDMRVLDILRGRSFSVVDTPLRGDEERIFSEKYEMLLRRWDELRAEYPDVTQ